MNLTNKKINVLTYAMNYSSEEERHTLGGVIINTSSITIDELKMEIRPTFNYISQSTEFIPAEFKGTSYTRLPVKGVVINSISGDAPIEFLDQLKQNKGEDITFEIRDLEINGQKVNNSN